MSLSAHFPPLFNLVDPMRKRRWGSSLFGIGFGPKCGPHKLPVFCRSSQTTVILFEEQDLVIVVDLWEL